MLGRSTVSYKVGAEAAALALDGHGRPWLVADGFLKTFEESGDLKEKAISVPLHDQTLCRANDAAFDPSGDLWITTMDRAGQAGTGQLLRYSLREGFLQIAAGLTIGNGPAFDSVRRVAYVADSPNRAIFRTSLVEREPLLPFVHLSHDEGYPDGMAVDHEGRLWVAHYGAGRVSIWSHKGDRVDTLPTPCACPTAIAVHQTGGDCIIAVTSVRQQGEPSAIWLRRYGTGTPLMVAHANTPPR
jgi:sugar lactone lactonase YvrE